MEEEPRGEARVPLVLGKWIRQGGPCHRKGQGLALVATLFPAGVSQVCAQ